MIPLLTEALGKLLSPLTKVTDSLKEATEAFNQYQRISLSLGQNFDAMSKKVAPSMDGLRGSIDQRLRSAFVGLEAGLQGNISGVSKLVNQQILTGSQFQKTAFVFAKLEAGLNISRESTNKLSESLINTGQTYEISTDRLVDVIDDLKETLPIQQLAGMGSELTAAVVELQGQFGPQFRGEINALMKIILDTSMEGFQKRIMLGIGDMPERLAAARTKEDKLALLYDAINAGANRFKMFSEGAESALYRVGIAENLLGKSSIQLTTLQNNIGKRIITRDEETESFYMQFSVIRKEFFLPLQNAFIKLLTPVLKVSEVFSAIGYKLSETIVERINKFIKEMGFSINSVDDLKISIIDGTIKIVEVFDDVVNVVISLKNALSNITITLLEFFGRFKEEANPYIRQPFVHSFDTSADAVAYINAMKTAEDSAYADVNFKITRAFKDTGPGYGITGPLSDAEDIIEYFLATAPGLRQSDQLRQALATSQKPNYSSGDFITKLEELRTNIKLNKPLLDSSEDTKEHVASIDNKTPDRGTMSAYLTETVTTLGSAIERVLGIPQAQNDLLTAILFGTNENTDAVLASAGLSAEKLSELKPFFSVNTPDDN